MNHEKEAQLIQSSIYARMTPAQKYQEMLKLRKAAWNLKRAGIRMLHPDWTDEQLEKAVREIFLYATTD